MWAKSGLLQREIKLYQKLIEKYGMDIQFITYGDEKDRKWQKHKLPQKMCVLCSTKKYCVTQNTTLKKLCCTI